MQIEATGKSVEIAIQNGLLECGMKREEVDVKIIEKGGLFKKAKVILSWGETNTEEVQEEKVEENVIENNEDARVEEIEIVEPINEENEVQEKKKRVVDTARLEKCASEFLLGLARIIDENATVESTTGENEISFAIKGEKLGNLIGYHGENLQSIQLLLGGLKLRSEWPIRMYLDIDGYKASKNQSLEELANNGKIIRPAYKPLFHPKKYVDLKDR